MRPLPRVCLVGAGSSGITVAKALWDRGIPFDCYEKGDRVGGNWVFKNKNGMSSSYRSLHINTSRDRMQYADYPMPRDYPHFPHHTRIAAYFEQYVDHFGFRHKIRFDTGVTSIAKDTSTPSIAPAGGPSYRVTLDDGTVHRYDAVIVASGHHWDPRWPEPSFPGSFDGVEMHSHHYVDPAEPHDLVDRSVVVLGMGNSAMDIACELSRPGVSRRVFLAMRRGAYVIPNYIFGRPLDQVVRPPRWLPMRLQQAMGQAMYRLAVGKMESYGLPAPDHRIGEAHPTISSELLVKLGRGDITPKPNIRERRGGEVVFADGSVETVDAIVYSTGYKVTFPFFDPSFIDPRDSDLPLFRRVIKPDAPGLYFAGLLQPLGAIMPLAEVQGRWIAEHLTGDYTLPSRAEMEADMAREREAMFRRYVASKRHTMQVDFELYMEELDAERARGRARARR